MARASSGQDLFKLLQSANRLPTAPPVAMRVLQLVQTEEASLGEIADAIRSDPALSARILRFVNSAIAGGPREVSSLNQAVCLIGLRGVQMITLSFSLISSKTQASCPSFDFDRFWSRSLACAVAAATIAQRTKGLAREEAFVTGLLSRIGQLVLVAGIPDGYERVLQAAEDRSFDILALERKIIGTTHAELGARLLREWQLPESIWRTVEQYRNVASDVGGEGRAPIGHVVLYTADLVASILCESSEKRADKVERVLLAADKLLGIDAEAWASVFDEIALHWEEHGRMLAVKTGEVQSFNAIRSEARKLLAEFSLAAELATPRS